MKKFMMRKVFSLFVLAALVAGICIPAGSQAETKKETETNGKLIVIDAGHQAKGNSSLEPIGPGAKQKKAKVASGTTGKWSKTPEYKLNLTVSKKLKTELEARGYTVKMIRTTHKVNISNAERAKKANKWKADAFIRVHANGSTNSSVSGALTMAPAKGNPYMSASNVKKSQKLSQNVIKAFCKATGANNQGVMKTNSMSGINWCKVPVTIVELGYMTNKNEDLKMATASYQKKMVQGIADGIDNYFK